MSRYTGYWASHRDDIVRMHRDGKSVSEIYKALPHGGPTLAMVRYILIRELEWLPHEMRDGEWIPRPPLSPRPPFAAEFREIWSKWEKRGYPYPLWTPFEAAAWTLWAYLDWIAATIEQKRWSQQ